LDISKHFGDLDISRGNKHTFLGINVKIEEGKIKLNMKEQIREAIEMFGEDVSCAVT
jgi:hypothetical protein